MIPAKDILDLYFVTFINFSFIKLRATANQNCLFSSDAPLGPGAILPFSKVLIDLILSFIWILDL